MQIGFQQMKDKKALEFMREYMVPNSNDNGIDGIKAILIKGAFTKEDYILIQKIFETSEMKDDTITVTLLDNQELIFKISNSFSVDVYTYGNNVTLYGNKIEIENVHVYSK